MHWYKDMLIGPGSCGGHDMFENYSITLGESFRKVVEEVLSGGTLCGESDSFKRGYLMALHRVFTLMTQAGDAYGVPLEALSLDSLTEEQFFL